MSKKLSEDTGILIKHKSLISAALFLALIISLCGCNYKLEDLSGEKPSSISLTSDRGRVFSPTVLEMPEADITITDATMLSSTHILLLGLNRNEAYEAFVLNLDTNSITKVDDFYEESIICIDPNTFFSVPKAQVFSSGSEDGSCVKINEICEITEGDSVSIIHLKQLIELPGDLKAWSLSCIRQDLKRGRFAADYESTYMLNIGDAPKKVKSYDGQFAIIRGYDNVLYSVETLTDKTIIEKIGHNESVFPPEYFVSLEKIECNFTNMYFYDGGTEDSLFAYSDGVIYRVSLSDGSRSAYANTRLSGVETGFVYLSDNSFFAVTRDGFPAIWRLDNSEDSKILKLLTCRSSDDPELWAINNTVRQFNYYQSQYCIDIINYGIDSDMETAYTRLAVDLISGKQADIYDFGAISKENCIRHGLVEDITPFFASDENLSTDMLFQSVYKLLSSKDALYELVPSFRLSTIFAPAEVISNADNWSADMLTELSRNFGCSQIFGADVTKKDYLEMLLAYNESEFVDKTTAQCSFTGDAFMQYISIMSGLPDEPDPTYSQLELIYLGEQLLYKASNDNCLAEMLLADGLFGCRAVAVGFPGAQGGKIAMSPSLRFGMSSQTAYKEGVWKFFAYLLGSSYQQSVSDIPVIRQIAEKRLAVWVAECMQPQSFGLLFYQNGQISKGSVTAASADENSLDRLLSVIDRINCSSEYDPYIFSIVDEELTNLFASGGSIEQATERIQNKVSIYLNEQYT